VPKTALPRALPLVVDGLVTRAALVAAGIDADLGDRLVREGTWLRLAPSIYLTGSGPPTDAQLVEAARLHVGDGAVVTGLIACRALGMSDVPDERLVEVLIGPGTRSASSPFVLVHQTSRPAKTWTRGGCPYAHPARAVVDGARRLPDLRTVRALVLGAVCRRSCTAEELRDEVEQGAVRGSGLVRRAVDDALAGAWSAPEAEAAAHVGAAVAAGRLPPFLLNPVLRTSAGRVGQPDGYVVGTGVGWQVQSRRHHAGEQDLETTLAVHDAYAAHDLTMLHLTPRRLRTLGPGWVELLIDAVVARAGRGEPEGLVVEQRAPLQTGWKRPDLVTPQRERQPHRRPR